MSLIQIAGIKNLSEAEMIVAAGADMIGFPLVLGYHKEDIDSHQVKKIMGHVKFLGIKSYFCKV
ncbi:MAG: hypothetical protein NT007_03540 [Candidatus Kapabacteria bacterium]|nr:hypothetical protein [Candidatus Kapabacteria bacterium]